MGETERGGGVFIAYVLWREGVVRSEGFVDVATQTLVDGLDSIQRRWGVEDGRWHPRMSQLAPDDVVVLDASGEHEPARKSLCGWTSPLMGRRSRAVRGEVVSHPRRILGPARRASRNLATWL